MCVCALFTWKNSVFIFRIRIFFCAPGYRTRFFGIVHCPLRLLCFFASKFLACNHYYVSAACHRQLIKLLKFLHPRVSNFHSFIYYHPKDLENENDNLSSPRNERLRSIAMEQNWSVARNTYAWDERIGSNIWMRLLGAGLVHNTLQRNINIHAFIQIRRSFVCSSWNRTGCSVSANAHTHIWQRWKPFTFGYY